MAETVNIAALAQSASVKIFNAFGWEMVGLQDLNFPCDKDIKHQTKSVGSTHPVDCVFYYPDPFSAKHLYFLCDLKSYALNTINSTKFGPYIRGLSKAIECAAINKVWMTRYVHTEAQDWLVDGLLFVYNHDNLYDKSFKEKADLKVSTLSHSTENRVHLLTPEDISYLESVAIDMKSYCGEFNLKYASRRFFFAQQLIYPPRESFFPIATMEMLRGKMLIVTFETEQKTRKCITYLKGTGSIDDFEYQITYFFRNGLMDLTESIVVKGTDFSSEAQVHFGEAKKQFLARHYKMSEIENALKRISFDRVQKVNTSFSPVDESKRRIS